MKRRKILIYFYGAFSPVRDGCHARVCSALDRLTAEFDEIAVYSYSNHPDFPWQPANVAAFQKRWPSIQLVLEPYTRRLKLLTRLKNLVISMIPAAADHLLRLSVPRWSPEFERVKADSCAILVNYTHGLQQMNGIDPAKCFVDTHDINFAKWAQITKVSSVSAVSLRKLRGEIGALQAAAAVVAISPTEAAFFRMMLQGDKVFYVGSWGAPSFPARRLVRPQPDIDLVFVGSGYTMNARGLCDMLDQHGEWLARYRISVCGLVCNDPNVIATAKRFPNITLLGYVEHPLDVYVRCKAALSPVNGTGLKMKILSALEAGIPVFASKQAFDGLPSGYEEAVFPISESNVTTILESDQRLEHAGAAALDYYAKLIEAGEASAVLDQFRSAVLHK